jgi:phage terminase large subunit-like protein
MGGRIPPLIPITHGHKSKGERFENWLAPRCQAARIWFSNVETPFLTEFYNEWLSWPNGKHDDTIDSVYMCAASAEGRLLDKAERSFFWKKKQEINPYLAFGDHQ